jgi:regulator of protease activity HflC (stomatin/prohibitin superfamily)
MVRIPEGIRGLLVRGGRYTRTIESGTHVIPPWILVSHLVTRREIPFDVPAVELPTKDNVRVNVDILITFSITDPYKFVYSISADDFDQVFQAICQDSLRAMVRRITSDEAINLTQQDMNVLREVLGEAVAPYGIMVMKINVTHAQPPIDFMRSQEARQLAVLQQAEQAEKQALAQQRQADEEVLARQQVIAQVEREREGLQAQVQQAEMRRRMVELEAEAEELRLAKLEERLAKYPHAAQWEVETLQLEIGRALAGNTRAVLQFGTASDIVRTFLMRDSLQQDDPARLADGQ